jgi:hypothetical protein
MAQLMPGSIPRQAEKERRSAPAGKAVFKAILMKRIALFLVVVVMLAGVIAWMVPASGQVDKGAAPIFVTQIPSGYRDWRLISVAHEAASFNSLGAILGNDVAIKAYREGTLPYPDGTIIAALHYIHSPSEENNRIFGRPQSFVPGHPTNIQFMVKDSKKYAATGGWGFGHFQDGKPGAEAFMKTCFPCHAQETARDLVFTHYAP